MKKTITLTLMLLVLISFGGLAQKPDKAQRVLDQRKVENITQYGRKKSFDENKEKYNSLTAEYRQLNLFRNDDAGKLKSTQALPLEKMDSLREFSWDTVGMKWILIDRSWFDYDSLGKNTSSTYLSSDTDTVFPEYGGKSEYIWNADDRIAESINYDWSLSSGFFKISRNQNEYDANGLPVVRIYSAYDTITQMWEPLFSDSIFYDGNMNLLIQSSYRYDTIIMDWVPEFGTEFEYDATGSDTLSRQLVWDQDSAKWLAISETFIYNDQMGRDTTTIEYFWNGSWWQESSKFTTRYNAAGAITETASYYWDGEASWNGSNKTEYVLDGNDRVVDEIGYNWDFFFADWFIYDKSTYLRDGSGNVIEETNSNYDTANQIYIPDWRDVYEYDLGTNWSDIAVPLDLNEEVEGSNIFTISSKVLNYYELYYDINLLVWDTVGVEFYYYSPLEIATQTLTCNADFSTTPGQGALDIIFTETSDRDASSWYWNFGDGTTSTLQYPMHTYKFPGTYMVSLSTADATGECTSTTMRQIKVGTTLCNAEFTMGVDTAGLAISLTNLSQGSNLNYFWSFGDGEVSKAMSPLHTYRFPGTYDVTLTIQNDLGTCMDRFSLSTRVGTAICRAGFDVFVDSANNSARFRARNQNPANIYRWEFGDGSVEKTPNVDKTFTHPGFYTARLTVANNTANCVNSQKLTVLIGRKSPGGKADFIYVSGDGNKVEFNDRSLGDDLKYFWNFNDGNASTDQNPTNQYALPGYYNVCLTVATTDGQRNTYCEKIFVGTATVDQCLAQFEYKLNSSQLAISCLDRSLGNPDKWLWTYSDGWTTTAQNPNWSTSKPAYVRIQQTIMNSTNGCRDDAFALVNMGETAKLKAGFGFVIDSTSKKADTYPVDFVGVSLGDAGKLKWTFGDGTADSTTINPTHVYAEPGTYEVCLTITNTTTNQEDVSCETITVGSAPSSVYLNKLEAGLKSYPNPFNENTRIEIRLINDSKFDLSLYDLMGRKVKTIAREQRNAGLHSFILDGSELEPGNYYLILKTDKSLKRTVLSHIR